LNIKEPNTPYDVSFRFTENTSRSIAQIKYACAIGILIYVMHCTKSDTAFTICKLSRYTSVMAFGIWHYVT
jgi:hypothetical protein